VPASTILGCGRHLPPRRVTNAELARELGTSEEAVAACAGIAERRRADGGLGPSDLGREAAVEALHASGLGPEDVDLIVFATMTPDIAFPGAGCFLQHKLGCRTVGALDVRAQCAGFLFALATADRYVRAGTGRVLVVGGELHTTAMDFSPRGAAVTPYFGDGAGAVVLGPGTRPGLLACVLHSDPDGYERFWCEYPASRHRPARMEREHFDAGLHYYRLDAAALHPAAERTLVEVATEALEQADVTIDRLALAIVHYVDPRIARRAADRLGVPAERVLATADVAGHVAAGGVPIALAEAVAAGRVGPGDLVLCAAFGAGLSWAGAVLRL
jgi:3-oxoacyl-[acyl-carrier-protein] synthase III